MRELIRLETRLEFHCHSAGVSTVAMTYAEPWSSAPYTVLSKVERGTVDREFKGPEWRDRVRAGEASYNPADRLRRCFISSPGGLSCVWAHFDFTVLGGLNFLAFFDVPLVLTGKAAETVGDVNARLAALCRRDAPAMDFTALAETQILGFRALEALLSVSRRRDDAEETMAGARRMEAVLRMAREKFHEDLSLAMLARKAGMSRSRFHECFRRVTGMSPGRYIRKLRMEKAAALLRTTALSVAEIAEKVGFADPFHFSRVFSATTGVCPRSYRESGGLRLS